MSLYQGSNASSLAVSFSLGHTRFFDNEVSASNIFLFDHKFIFVVFSALIS